MRRAATSSLFACLVFLAGCEDNGWWCHTAEYANDHDSAKPPHKKLSGKRKCYRSKEYCSGTCTELETAYCFDIGSGSRTGRFHSPPDRNCYATSETCIEAQQANPEASSACRPADK